MGANRRNKYRQSRRFAPSYRLMEDPKISGEYYLLLENFNICLQNLKINPCKDTYDKHIAAMEELSAFVITHQKNFNHG